MAKQTKRNTYMYASSRNLCCQEIFVLRIFSAFY